MKVVHLSGAGWGGGASIAMRRIHESLIELGIGSEIWLSSTAPLDPNVKSVGRGARFRGVVSREVSNVIVRSLTTENHALHSPSVFGSRLAAAVNQSDGDVVHLHWTQGEMLSIRDIKKIRKPIVWTLHDMWPFCGAEHHSSDARWSEGYLKSNRPDGEAGFDLNRWTWKRKKRSWTKPLQLVAPSDWLASCATTSDLFRDWPIEVVPHPIDVSSWQPVEKKIARRALGLSDDKPVLLASLYPSALDYWKGRDLLEDALRHIILRNPEVQLVFLGNSDAPVGDFFPAQTKHFAALSDVISRNLAYSAADAFVLTSRQEAFSLSAQEALSSGTPVIAFDNSGPTSFVKHKQSGYLASAFDVKDFVDGIAWALSLRDKTSATAIHESIAQIHSSTLIASRYADIYGRVL